MFLSGFLSKMNSITGVIIALCVIIGACFGAYTFLCHQMDSIAEAKDLKKEIVIVQTLQEQQKVYQEQQKINEKEIEKKDLEVLELLQNQMFLLKKQFEKDPENNMLEDKIKSLQRKIEQYETKLYG